MNWNFIKGRWSRTTYHSLGIRKREEAEKKKSTVKRGNYSSKLMITKNMMMICLTNARKTCKPVRSVRMSPFLECHSGNLWTETYARIFFDPCNRATTMRQVSSSWCWSGDASTVWSSTAMETRKWIWRKSTITLLVWLKPRLTFGRLSDLIFVHFSEINTNRKICKIIWMISSMSLFFFASSSMCLRRSCIRFCSSRQFQDHQGSWRQLFLLQSQDNICIKSSLLKFNCDWLQLLSKFLSLKIPPWPTLLFCCSYFFSSSFSSCSHHFCRDRCLIYLPLSPCITNRGLKICSPSFHNLL